MRFKKRLELNAEFKPVLLLSPQNLLKNSGIIKALDIVRSGKTINYNPTELTDRGATARFIHLPKPVAEIMQLFAHAANESRNTNIRSKYQAGLAGTPFKDFYDSALLRELQVLFENLKPFTGLFKWYDQVWNDKSKSTPAPCSFSKYRPQLAFTVVKGKQGLQLKIKININGAIFSFGYFQRYHFLLSSVSEYFLLSFNDFKTLEWLATTDITTFSHDPAAFARNILAPLEKDYPVNRNGLFPQHIIEVRPTRRVLLSEISNSFVVLTPQWVYEGFVVEGPWKVTYEITKAGEAYLVKRNREEELAFTKQLESLHPNFIKQLNGYYYLAFAEAIKKQWFFKTYHFLLEQDIQVVGMDMLRHFRYSPEKASTSVEIMENKGDTVELRFELRFGKEEVGLADLQKSLWAGQRAILLKDGSLGVLGDEWIEQYGSIIKHGKASRKTITIAPGMALTEAPSLNGNRVLDSVLKHNWWEQWNRWQQHGELNYQVPARINATLRPYQHKGFEWMVLLADAGCGACLADDMGLGKTLQAICFLAHRAERFPGQLHLIITPSSLLYNWEQELRKFAPSLSVFLYHSANRNFDDLAGGDQQIILTTFGTMRADAERIAGLTFGTAIIDESHNIKNPAAQITRAVNQLNASTRIALSGTPVMNNTFDLYAQLSFVIPGMFGSREFFKREYADAIDRDQDAEKTRALQKLTAPFILRRTKEQVAPDLPEKMETILWCEMGAAQRQVYELVMEEVRNNVFLEIKEKGLNNGKLGVIQGLLKLRQLCNSGELLKDDFPACNHSIKTDVLVEEIKNIIPNHKALVFSQFTTMLDLLEKRFDLDGISFCRLDGDTPIARRQELVNNFQLDNSHESVFLISLKAGGAGLNLTAADYVFLFDPWWNGAMEQQAIDRTHRIGQVKTVFAYKMICRNTVEEKIIQLQQRKNKLAAELIGEVDGFVKTLTEADIEFLFS